MKPLLVWSKTKPLWFYRKPFFDFFKSIFILLVKKPLDWESLNYKFFISFLENIQQFQRFKIVRAIKNIFQYLIFQLHQLKVLLKKRIILIASFDF